MIARKMFVDCSPITEIGVTSNGRGRQNLSDNETGDEEAPELADIAAPGFDRQVISKFAALGQRCLDL